MTVSALERGCIKSGMSSSSAPPKRKCSYSSFIPMLVSATSTVVSASYASWRGCVFIVGVHIRFEDFPYADLTKRLNFGKKGMECCNYIFLRLLHCMLL